MDLPAVSYDDLVNLTMNRSTIKDEEDAKGQELDLIIVILTSLILGLMILTTVIGKYCGCQGVNLAKLQIFRKCFCDGSHPSRQASTVSSKLSDIIIGCCRFTGGYSGHAIGGCLWGNISYHTSCIKIISYIIYHIISYHIIIIIIILISLGDSIILRNES